MRFRPPTSEEVVARMANDILVMPNGCWEWTRATNADGYGVLGIGGVKGKNKKAHRVMFEAMRGPIPGAAQLDHTCHNEPTCRAGSECRHRRCVNPAHLEPSTTRRNTLNGHGITAVNARKTKCLREHPLSPDNLLASRDGKRRCKTCHRERARAARTRR